MQPPHQHQVLQRVSELIILILLPSKLPFLLEVHKDWTLQTVYYTTISGHYSLVPKVSAVRGSTVELVKSLTPVDPEITKIP